MRWLVVLVAVVPHLARAAPRGPSPKRVADRIVAVVNDAVILTSELDLRMSPIRAQAMQIANPTERVRRIARLERETLDEMVADQLVLQAARDAKLTIDEAKVESAVEYIKQQNHLDDKQLAAAMAAQGVTRETLRDDLLRQRAIANFVLPKVHVSDEDVRARYEELARRSALVSAVNVSQILIALPEHPTEPQLRAARNRATRALDRIRAGEAFATVAAEMSDDDTTKASGGVLGWLEPAALDPRWESVVMGMNKGDLRGPITGDKGLYVLLASDVKRTHLDPFPKMKPALASQLERAQLAKLTRSWIADLRKKAYIEIKLR